MDARGAEPARAIEQARAAAIVRPPDLGEDLVQQERVAVSREDVDVWPFPDEPPERRHLVGREVDEEVLLEGRLNEEGVEGTARHVLACGARDVDAGAGEGIDVDMVETAPAREDRRVRGGVLPDDLELDLRPGADVVERHPEPPPA